MTAIATALLEAAERVTFTGTPNDIVTAGQVRLIRNAQAHNLFQQGQARERRRHANQVSATNWGKALEMHVIQHALKQLEGVLKLLTADGSSVSDHILVLPAAPTSAELDGITLDALRVISVDYQREVCRLTAKADRLGLYA